MTDHADLIFRLSEKSDPESRDAHDAIRALVAERDEALRHVEQLQEKFDPEHSCACSYDVPDTICGFHSPMLAKAEAKLDETRALLREAAYYLKTCPLDVTELLARIDALLAGKEGTT